MGYTEACTDSSNKLWIAFGGHCGIVLVAHGNVVTKVPVHARCKGTTRLHLDHLWTAALD